jgi:hypothetical protein
MNRVSPALSINQLHGEEISIAKNTRNPDLVSHVESEASARFERIGIPAGPVLTFASESAPKTEPI